MTSLQDFDQAQRDQAASHGRALNRMAGPAIPVETRSGIDTPPPLFLWLRGGKLVSSGPSGTVGPADPAMIRTAFQPGSGLSQTPIVVTDSRALKAALRIVERAGPTGEAAAVAMKFCTQLAVSQQVIVLTDALRRKLWMPTGMNDHDINDWRKALLLEAGPQALRDMHSIVIGGVASWDTQIGVKGLLEKAHKTAISCEKAAVSSRTGRGPAEAIRSFQSSERLGEAWNAIERFDPMLRERCIHEGTVARFTPLSREAGTAAVVGLTTQPFKVREGSVVVMPDKTGEVGRAKLASVSFDATQDGLCAHLLPDRKAGEPVGGTAYKSFRPVDGCLIGHYDMFITASPFLSVPRTQGSSGRGGRWTFDGDGDGPTVGRGRDIPFDVIIAGGIDAD